MQEKIKHICKNIEKKYDIKILFAIEAGSRVWRMDSKDSDYDVRFVYYRDSDEYLNIKSSSDVIDRAYDKDGNPCDKEGGYIDLVGFDIYKFVKLLMNSNPSMIEWIRSDIIYYGEKPKEWIDWAENSFNPIAVYMHYKSMCKQNYLKYIKSGDMVTYKKYLYAMRGLR